MTDAPATATDLHALAVAPVSIRDLATELLLHRVSVREFCRSRGIPLHPRLPRGASGGQLEAHVTDKDAKRIRAHYKDRLAGRKRSEPTAAA